MAFDKTLFYDKVRKYIRDFEAKNRLLDWSLENEDSDIELALDMALNEMNYGVPPMTDAFYSPDSFEDGNISFMLEGVVAFLLESSSMEQVRNRQQYEDGGATVQMFDRFPEYTAFADKKKQDFQRKVTNVKRMIASEEAWGNVDSISSFLYNFR